MFRTLCSRIVVFGVMAPWPVAAHAQCTPAWTGLGTTPGTVVNGLATIWGIPGVPIATHIAACGGASSSGSVLDERVAVWHGTWTSLRHGGLTVNAVAGAELVPGASVFAGGNFTTAGAAPAVDAALWSTGAWSALGMGLSPGSVFALHWCNAPPPLGPKLYAGGQFSVAGSAKARGVAAWNGASWEPLGTGLAPAVVGQTPRAHAFALYDDDQAGPRTAGVYVGGNFATAGGVAADSIARWDGISWEPLAEGTDNLVRALCVFDPDGAGPIPESLFAGGPGVNYNGLTRWDGQQWHAVPGWVSGSVHCMAVFDDDGAGPNKPALFVAGLATLAGTLPNQRILKWDGALWHSVGGGVSQPNFSTPEVFALSVFDEDGTGPNPGGLYVGGWFNKAGTVDAPGIARWGCPPPPYCAANCNLSVHPATGAHTLSIADFACFQARFALFDPWADCNSDGQFSTADFACFQSRFAAGCP